MRFERFSIALLFLLGGIFCGSSELIAEDKPSLEAKRLFTPPQIDGDVLADSAWDVADKASGFTQQRPYNGQAASQKTEVYVGYTKDTLYVGVICFDSDPDSLIVSDSGRDSSLSDVDSFTVIFDSFLDRQNGLMFGTTPTSIEYDGQIMKEGSGRFGSGGGAVNMNWDVAWTVKSQIGDYGWSAEFAIPFRSLRYGPGELQDWGLNFQRNIARNDETSFWVPLERQYNLYRVSEAGTLKGLRPPNQKSLKLTPYALGLGSKGGVAGNETITEGEFGFDAKYLVTPSLTLDATYNTDFAQVEADEVQVNLDRFSIFLPEKRPFFLENAGLFSVGAPREIELFFSRRIGIGLGGAQQPIAGGLRLSGKVAGSTNIGLLHMQTEEINELSSNRYSVARVNWELENRSSLGSLLVSRDGDGKDNFNRTYAVDGRWGIGNDNTFSGFLAKTDSPDFDTDDYAGRLRFNRNTQSLTQSYGYTKVGGNFNPEVGFLSRRNYEKVDAMLFHRRRPEDYFGIFEIRPHTYYRAFFDETGYYQSGFWHIDNHIEWHNGWEIHTGINFTHEGVKNAFQINPGTYVPPGDYDHKESQLVLMTDNRKSLYFEWKSYIGGFYGGDRRSLETKANYRLGDAFTAALTWSHNNIDMTPFADNDGLSASRGDFKVNVARLRMSYSITPKMQIQMLVQSDDRKDLLATNFRFSWLQDANSGLYIVYNEVDDLNIIGPMEKRREFALKYSRIFDVLR
mgnify:FL=1